MDKNSGIAVGKDAEELWSFSTGQYAINLNAEKGIPLGKYLVSLEQRILELEKQIAKLLEDKQAE